VATLLIADDNVALRDTLVDILHKEFTIVGIASSAKEILDQVPVLHPDIVVLDISLGDSTGFDVVRKLKSAGTRCKFVFVSVHESPSFIAAARELGASGYVFKSQISRDLLQTLQSVANEGPFSSSQHDHPDATK
jgi:DNA-binding NarL/FixJ family response regulator